MLFEHERPPASETTPLLVPPTSSGEPEEGSQQLGGDYKPEFDLKDIVWVVAAIWSAVFLGALDGAHSSTGGLTFPDFGNLSRDYRCNSHDSCKTSTSDLRTSRDH